MRHHAREIWVCDFLPVTDVAFRPVFAFFIIELATRRVVHVGVTRHPTAAWAAQQLREATTFGQRSQYLIRDHDGKYAAAFASVAAASGITILRTPDRAPRANAVGERFLGSATLRACCASTSPTATRRGHTRDSAKPCLRRQQRRPGPPPARYVRCPS